MVFDGGAHTQPAVVGRFSHSSGAPAVATVYANALKTSYHHAKASCRLIGIQTHLMFLDQRWNQTATRPGLSATSFTAIAAFKRYRPSQMNHIRIWTSWRLAAPGSSLIYHRMNATDGTTLVTGEITEDTHPGRAFHRGARRGDAWDDTVHALGASSCSVDISTLDENAYIDLAIEAYAVDEAGAAVMYSPELSVAYYMSLEG